MPEAAVLYAGATRLRFFHDTIAASRFYLAQDGDTLYLRTFAGDLESTAYRGFEPRTPSIRQERVAMNREVLVEGGA